MLKKFFALMILLLMIAAPVSAMRLELHPQPVGRIAAPDNGKFFIEGATKISGDGSGNYYSKGVAVFADKNYPRENPKQYGSNVSDTFPGEPIYFHFDAEKKLSNLGGSDVKNSMAIDFFKGDREIYLINNTSGHSLYLLKMDTSPGDAMIIIGVNRDGKWVELLDVQSLRKKYDLGWNYVMTKFFTVSNKIVFRYQIMTETIDVVCRFHEVNREFYTEAIKS